MLRILAILLLISPLVWAKDKSDDSSGEPAAVPEPPELPMPVESGEILDEESPEITIKRRGKKTIQEYRINGELYMVKIVPDVGPAYYMIDSNGDGNLNVRRSDLERNLKIPQWVLFRW